MAVISALGISLGSTIVGYVNVRQQVQDRLDSVSASKMLALRNWTSDLQNGLLIAVNDQSADERINITLDFAGADQYYTWYNEAVRLRLLKLIQQSQQFEDLCLIDKRGLVALCTGPLQTGADCSGEIFFASAMASAVEGGNIQALQQFVGLGAWSDAQVIRTHQTRVARRLGRPEGVLLLDGCDLPKQGQHPGVARQYCGPLGKIANCQASVVLAPT